MATGGDFHMAIDRLPKAAGPSQAKIEHAYWSGREDLNRSVPRRGSCSPRRFGQRSAGSIEVTVRVSGAVRRDGRAGRDRRQWMASRPAAGTPTPGRGLEFRRLPPLPAAAKGVPAPLDELDADREPGSRHRGSLLQPISASKTPAGTVRLSLGSETPIRSRSDSVVLVDQPAEQVPPADVVPDGRDRDRSSGQR